MTRVVAKLLSYRVGFVADEAVDRLGNQLGTLIQVSYWDSWNPWMVSKEVLTEGM